MKKKYTAKKLFSVTMILGISCAMAFITSCSDGSTPPPPSSQYYVTYTWSGESDYQITYWLQSESKQYLSNNSGSDTSQGSLTSQVFSHPNTENLTVKTAIEFSNSQCANVQLKLFRDSIEVMVKDYVMGDPANQNCTGENFRQATYTP